MQIELASLEGTDGRFTQTYESRQLNCNDERLRQYKPLTITGRISRSKGRVFVRGKIDTAAQVECDRCLELVELPVDVEFGLEYITSETYEALQTAELSERDLALSVFDGEAVDIDELVCEQLSLAVPLRVLCRENCRGLCPVCGGDRNVADCACEADKSDPRWEALRELANGK